MKHKALETSKACLHYRQYGKGSRTLLCFHGYGQDHEVYRALEERYGAQYTIFSFDLFYHGQSFWHDKDKPISLEDWQEIIVQFFKEHHIERFSLVGFSMGARFALVTFNAFSEKVDQLILLAPDGLEKRFLYWLMTSFTLTRKVLRYLVTNPTPYLKATQLLLKLRLIDKGVIRFTETQMKTRSMRRRVYYSWTMFRMLFVSSATIAKNIEKHKVGMRLYMGDFDKVIPLDNVKPLLRYFPESLRRLPVGHTELLKTWIQTNGAL